LEYLEYTVVVAPCQERRLLAQNGKLFLRGPLQQNEAPAEVVFQDARGRRLDQGESEGSSRIRMGSLSRNGAAAPLREYVDFEDLPEEMDHETWQRYSHLIRQDPRTGRFRFTPGYVERAAQADGLRGKRPPGG
jgi:hypothetical protein